ncbi:MAG: ABC transporter permease [Campylobacterota bacterium]|nr:ABC transporter permease [Campylobacterota bacterium]
MQLIPVSHLFFMLLPLAVVGYFYYTWLDNAKEILYATLRMVIQLVLIGYALIYIFENDSIVLGIGIILMMISMSSLITLRNISNKSFSSYFIIFISIAFGGSINLILVLEVVLDLTPFYEPRYVIPIAGMIYANCMDAISIAAERFEKEIQHSGYDDAKKIAFKSALIPSINAFLAVGLVSLPGMMTGQILSGVDPLIAVRYQMVVMAMVLGSSGISIVTYLTLKKKQL